MVYGTLDGAYDWSKGTQIRADNNLIPLYNSQGEETVFLVTGIGRTLNEVHWDAWF